MPREIRPSSHHTRYDPIQRSPELPSTHRQTSIWTVEDDETLMMARAQGMNWQPIASAHFPHKSGNACRKRHERLMEKRSNEDWDGIKFETLAAAYMAVRQQMWTILADRVGDKWTNIEAKCMEKGIKNISAAFKTRRKERDYVPTTTAVVCGPTGYMSHVATTRAPMMKTSTSPPMLSSTSPSLMTSASPSFMVSASPSLNSSTGSSSIMASSAPYMQHYPRQRYHPVPIQPMPDQGSMMMRGAPMLPGPYGRNMSIHSMLSPSPPADDDEEG